MVWAARRRDRPSSPHLQEEPTGGAPARNARPSRSAVGVNHGLARGAARRLVRGLRGAAVLRIPTDVAARVAFVQDVVGKCMASRESCREAYRTLRQFYLYGAEESS